GANPARRARVDLSARHGCRRDAAGCARRADSAASGADISCAAASGRRDRRAGDRGRSCAAALPAWSQRRTSSPVDHRGSQHMIAVTERDGIAIVTLAHGKANAMDMEFCAALTKAFVKLKTSKARAVVLTGQGGIFSAGVNLVRARDGGPRYIRKF